MALLSSSDTGMFNNDNVTNKMQPAFGGVGPANRPIFVFAQGTDSMGNPLGEPFVVGTGTVNADGTDGIIGNGLGTWEVTVEPMADGKYNFFARFDVLVVNADITTDVLTEEVASAPVTKTQSSPKAIPANGVAVSLLPITTIDFASTAVVADINVTVNIVFSPIGDLALTLVSPSGINVLLSNRRGGTGTNFTNTVFDDAAGSSITSIVPAGNPFTGSIPSRGTALLPGRRTGEWNLVAISDQCQRQYGHDRQLELVDRHADHGRDRHGRAQHAVSGL